MSILGFYFVTSTLRELGWPRKQGWFRRATIDTTITDATIDQMINWAASLGAGRPTLALSMIAEMFRDRDWESDDAPDILVFINLARPSWDNSPNASPCEIAKPFRLAKMFGREISPDTLKQVDIRQGLEQMVLTGILWGLANPDRFAQWYASSARLHDQRIHSMQKVGLAVTSSAPLEAFFKSSEQIVQAYQRDIQPLHPIPEKLSSDAREIGVTT